MTKEELNSIYEKIVKSIDISNELFDKASDEYDALGKWMDNQTPNYKLSIYPQGSFVLGTVIKPIWDDDTYDLDLVCEFEKQYGLSAKEIKVDVVGDLLKRYKKATEIEEKRRCWHVEYDNMPNFHMDVIPAVLNNEYLEHIDITERNKEYETYSFIGSNPKGYIEWFNSKKAERRQFVLEKYAAENHLSLQFQADVQKIKEYNVKTPLQKAIQLLKRHRDIMFQDDLDIKPISIIITTIAAELYRNEENIADTLFTILTNAKSYILSQKQGDKYYINNPSYTGKYKENFADKWAEQSELADAFFDWLENAKALFADLNYATLNESEALNILGVSLGDNAIKRAFAANKDAIKFIEAKSDDTSLALVPYKVKDIINAPHRQKSTWGTPPKGSRITIVAKATLPSGEIIPLKSDGRALEKGTYINFTAVYGGRTNKYSIRWQIVNYGVAATAANGLRGGFESGNVGKSITEHCEYAGHHGVLCYVTQGSNKTLYKSDVFIVNIK